MIAIDLFAGGGGASEGIRLATGVEPIIAINHCRAAIDMHAANHPGTIHLHESVWDVHAEDFRGEPVDLLWASPDCKHFSRAKGGKPREKGIRSLAWVVVDWARDVRPRVIALENVEEFRTWGPLDAQGQPDPARKGETFHAFVQALEGLGYAVEHRVLNAADYGAPTSRKRLFLVARRDGQDIRWPDPSHGPGRALPWRTAAECIDWSIPVPSIFDRKRPLAEATQRRIAEGIRRFVLTSPRPFLLCLTHGGRLEPLDLPLRTTTTANRGERALVVPTLAQVGYGERAGQRPRALDLHAPLGTIVAGGPKHALVAAFLAQHNGGANGHQAIGQDLGRPMSTIAGNINKAVGAVYLSQFNGRSVGSELGQPGPTTTGRNHSALVAAFLLKYYSEGGQWSALDEPMHTVVERARMGLVTVEIDGETYALVDIGMRMLQPHELLAAQGFRPDYVLTGTKAEQVARIGNSVCPPVVEALVRSLFDLQGERRAA